MRKRALCEPRYMVNCVAAAVPTGLRCLALAGALAAGLAAALTSTAAQAQAQPPAPERISSNALGEQANGDSAGGSISDDGTVVAFWSRAWNLQPGDFDTGEDANYAYLRDRPGNTTAWLEPPDLRGVRITYPILSRDGRYAVFLSNQTNFVPGDENNADYFRKDLVTGEILRVNQPPGGGSDNGQVIEPASVSADGRFVAFASTGSLLVPGGGHAGWPNIYVRDMASDQIEWISRLPDGSTIAGPSRQPVISGDGRHVLFWALEVPWFPPRLRIYLHDRQTASTEHISVGMDGAAPNNGTDARGLRHSVSDDGRYVLFGFTASNLVPGDSNGVNDLFLRDRQLGTTTRVSLDLDGSQLDAPTLGGTLSADGRRIVYVVAASEDWHPVYWLDRSSGQRGVLNSQGRALPQGTYITTMALSGTGDYLVLDGDDALADGPDNGFNDVFLYDLRDLLPLFANGFE